MGYDKDVLLKVKKVHKVNLKEVVLNDCTLQQWQAANHERSLFFAHETLEHRPAKPPYSFLNLNGYNFQKFERPIMS